MTDSMILTTLSDYVSTPEPTIEPLMPGWAIVVTGRTIQF